MDNNFWVDTYQRNIKKLIGLCYRYVQNSTIAEDIAHNAFLTAMQKADSYKGLGEFDAWLRRITINACLQHLNKEKKQQIDYQELNTQNLLNDDIMFWGYNFTKQELMDATLLLPEHHRLVFNLYVIDGFSHKQIAQELNISEGTSKSHLARARKKLQEILRKKAEEDDRRRALFWFILPCKGLNKTYKKHFHDYEIAPQQANFIDKIKSTQANIPHIKNTLSATPLAIASSAVVVGGLAITFSQLHEKPTPPYHDNATPTTYDSIIPIATDTTTTHTITPQADTTKKSDNQPVVVKKRRHVVKKVVVSDTITIKRQPNAQ